MVDFHVLAAATKLLFYVSQRPEDVLPEIPTGEPSMAVLQTHA